MNGESESSSIYWNNRYETKGLEQNNHKEGDMRKQQGAPSYTSNISLQGIIKKTDSQSNRQTDHPGDNTPTQRKGLALQNEDHTEKNKTKQKPTNNQGCTLEAFLNLLITGVMILVINKKCL